MPHVLKDPIGDNPLRIYKVTKNGVILEVNMDTPEAAAEWPYLSAGWKYLTYTLGEDHSLTAIGHDALRTSLGVSGRSGTTVGLDQDLWGHVIQTAREGGILTDMPFGSIVTSAEVFMRDGGTAQITLEGRSSDGAVTKDFTVLPGGSVDEAIEALERRFPQHGKITTEPNHYVGTVWKCAIPDAPSVPKELLTPAAERGAGEAIPRNTKAYSYDEASQLIECYALNFNTSLESRDLMRYLAEKGGSARETLIEYIATDITDAVRDDDNNNLNKFLDMVKDALGDEPEALDTFKKLLRDSLGVNLDVSDISEERA